MGESTPIFENAFGSPGGAMDMLPKPACGKLPLLITGSSQQDEEWIAHHGDGWMIYPRDLNLQSQLIDGWRKRLNKAGRAILPVLQPLYIDLTENPDQRPQPIHLGFRLGIRFLREYLEAARSIGINHIAVNLRFNRTDVEDTMRCLGDEIVPDFHC